MAQQMGNQPLIVLSDDSQRTSGKDAQSMNITAGQAVAESVRTTLGPKGMDKMLVSDAGDVVVTNDGVTILSEMDIEHPAANMIVEVAETQEDEVGDGLPGGDVHRLRVSPGGALAVLREYDEGLVAHLLSHSQRVIECDSI